MEVRNEMIAIVYDMKKFDYFSRWFFLVTICSLQAENEFYLASRLICLLTDVSFQRDFRRSEDEFQVLLLIFFFS